MADLGLGLAVYTNLCEMWRGVGIAAPDQGTFEVVQRPDMLLVRSLYSQRVPHTILDPRPPERQEAAWTAALVRDLGSGPISLMLALPPGTEGGPLATALHAEGFQPETRPKIAMARVATATGPLHDPEIHLARSAAELAEARDLLGQIFGLPSAVFAYYTPAELVSTYVLRHHGTPLAAVCLCPFAGSAGIYSVGVLPRARGRGYARRLVRVAVADAAAGVNTAVLSCERTLVDLYRPLGFTVVWELNNYWLEAWWR